MDNIKIIIDEVTKLLGNDDSGHGMDHVNRVCRIALSISDDNIDKDLVAAIALLHDADDYKLFGMEYSNNLTNTQMILSKTSFTEDEKKKILDSIRTIGYSKRLSGITPTIKEAMIVSDADMLDAMGVTGILRSYHYNITHGNPFFDKDTFPLLEIDADKYKSKTKGTVVNHIFEKLLKLKDLMLTEKGKKESIRRYNFIIDFLNEYFYEEDVSVWQDYLNEYIKNG